MDDKQQARPAHRWPRNRQRERVLHLVREHDGPIDAAELASQMGLHVTTVRFHLDALCDQGVVARTRIASSGVGRPRTGYVSVQGQLDYQALAEILALELGDTIEKRRRRAEHAGRRWAQRLTAGSISEVDEPGTALDHRSARTAEIFERMGFGPELTRPDDPAVRTIRLHACPVRELAAARPEVGCALHRGLLEGLISEPKSEARSTLRAELEPFVGPELCVARVIARD
ncbi:transcriptional regulator [Mycobacterium sp. MFM001]|uniref:helix-turn-helix transcriptional regulator n=1 Tax=Mycobacterium sp. MFM001 TaxID=2049453 RepID=UPI000DA5376E|nr:HTH domain-containing protein [Mycobacterium sp. MFM001]GBE64339.1 transcriptional regulator [Mycobacterium sp. MFM001]